MAMKGKYVTACTTKELEVQAQYYNGDVVGSYSVELAFDYKCEKPVETVEGMQKLQNFEFQPDGSIRVRRTFGIVRGKVMSKDELDKKIIVSLLPY